MPVSVVRRPKAMQATGGMAVKPVHDKPPPYEAPQLQSRYQQLHRVAPAADEAREPEVEAAEPEPRADPIEPVWGDEIDRALVFYRKHLEKRRKYRKRRRESVKAKLRRLAELESKTS